MKDIIIKYDALENQRLWESFMAFFRYVKGYTDWNEEEIALSMNKDDFNEFIEWARKVLDFNE